MAPRRDHVLFQYDGSTQLLAICFSVSHVASDHTLKLFANRIKFDYIRVAGGAAEGRKNKGNTFAMVKLPDDAMVPVYILFVFKKAIQINGPETVAEAKQYMHVLRLKELAMEEAFGGEVPSKELFVKMKIRFARKDAFGEEMVLPISTMTSQLVVVPLHTQNSRYPEVFGLKSL